ncbi:hypothetical protein HPB49_001298 [Dermacentor silvarum]|uniref:Uncharacterized protein n=1 Tax=Dermacentor silvarum TaxID=543639 RepID=A0ACB8CCQ9_DERSI|nr:hypothetical protein HPB49_001298 [Dermacentor silvarum]
MQSRLRYFRVLRAHPTAVSSYTPPKNRKTRLHRQTFSQRLRQKSWKVELEPHCLTTKGTRIPDLVIRRDGQTIILDAQVVGTRIRLSDAPDKRNKYLFPELLALVDPTSRAVVSSVTLS